MLGGCWIPLGICFAALAPGFPGLWPYWPYFWGMCLSHILPFPLLEKYRSNKPDYEKWKPKPTKTEPLFVSWAWIQMAPRQAPKSRGGNGPSPFPSHPCPQSKTSGLHILDEKIKMAHSLQGNGYIGRGSKTLFSTYKNQRCALFMLF